MPRLDNDKVDSKCEQNKNSVGVWILKGKNVDDVGYGLPLEIYNNFAYYLCITPFRFKRTNQKYVLHGWWFQRILCYVTAVWQLLNQLNVSKGALLAVLEESFESTGNPKNYFLLFERVVELIWNLTILYHNFFQEKPSVKFLNGVERYSKLYYPTVTGKWRKMIWSRCWITRVTVLIVASSVSNLWKRADFITHYKDLCLYVNKHWYWSTQVTCDIEIKNVLTILLMTIPSVITGWTFHQFVIRQLAPIISLWLIAYDFKKKSMRNISKTNIILKQYRRIYRLSRQFSDVYGFIILSNLIFVVLYYSVNLGKVLVISERYGRKFYYIENLINCILTFGLAAHFAHLNLSAISSLLQHQEERYRNSPLHSSNIASLLLHWQTNNICAIQAKIFHINFSTIFEFMSCLMLLFVVSVTPPCPLIDLCQ